MSIVWGAVLAAGLLLVLSPWMWPSSPQAEPTPRRGRLVALLEEAGLAHAPVGRVPVVSGLLAAVAGTTVWLITS